MGLKFKTPKTNNQPERGPSPAKRNVSKWQWYFLVLILLSPLLFMGFKFVTNLWFVKATGVVSFEPMQIKAPADGYIKKVYVDKSDRVKADELLIKFHSPAVDKRIQLLQQELNTLQKAKNSATNQQKASLKQMQEQAQTNVQKSLAFYKRFKEYQDKGLISQMQLKDAWDDVHAARNELLDIKRRLQASQQSHQFTIERQYNKRIRQIKTELAKLKSLKKRFDITVHQPAIVKHVAVHTGEYVTQGQTLLHLVTHSQWRIRAYIAPKYADQVYKGKPVTIELPNNTDLKGRVSSNPNLTGQRSQSNSFLKQQSNQIVFFVQPDQKMPDKFKSHGMPVKIDIGNAWGINWFEWLQGLFQTIRRSIASLIQS